MEIVLFFCLTHSLYWGRNAKATEAPPSLGTGETAQRFWAHNQQSAGWYNPPSSSERNARECVSWHSVFLGESFSGVVVWLAVYLLFIAAEVSCNLCPAMQPTHSFNCYLIKYAMWSCFFALIFKDKCQVIYQVVVFQISVLRVTCLNWLWYIELFVCCVVGLHSTSLLWLYTVALMLIEWGSRTHRHTPHTYGHIWTLLCAHFPSAFRHFSMKWMQFAAQCGLLHCVS